MVDSKMTWPWLGGWDGPGIQQITEPMIWYRLLQLSPSAIAYQPGLGWVVGRARATTKPTSTKQVCIPPYPRPRLGRLGRAWAILLTKLSTTITKAPGLGWVVGTGLGYIRILLLVFGKWYSGLYVCHRCVTDDHFSWDQINNYYSARYFWVRVV